MILPQIRLEEEKDGLHHRGSLDELLPTDLNQLWYHCLVTSISCESSLGFEARLVIASLFSDSLQESN